MSVLNKKPFINTVLEGLSEQDQVKLNNLLNGQGDRTQLQRILGLASGMRTPITEADKGVHLCSLQIGPNAYDGYLLYTDDKCCLVWFTDFQTLSMFDIDVAKQKFAVVSEYLDITELRSSLNILLVEAGHAVKIQADDVDSGSATQGQVLVADGAGGASWGEASGGGDGFPTIDLDCSLTIAQLCESLSIDLDTIAKPYYKKVFVNSMSHENEGNMFSVFADNPAYMFELQIHSRGYNAYYIYFYTQNGIATFSTYNGSEDAKGTAINQMSFLEKREIVPSTSSLDSAKTYQLQTAGQGNPAWQEASGGGTQLYKHSVRINGGYYEFSFFATSGEELTADNFADIRASSLTNGVFGNNAIAATIFDAGGIQAKLFNLFVGGNTLYLKEIDLKTWTSGSNVEVTNITDTVTPL